MFFRGLNSQTENYLAYLCAMLKILVLGVVGYVIYTFVIRFLVPLAKLVRMTHHSINEVKQKMQNNTQQQQPKGNVKQHSNPQVEGDYIDFEEIK